MSESDPTTSAERVAPEGLADRIAKATLSVPGVRRLHGGGYAEVGTYLAGRRIVGVRTGPLGTEVHVVASTDQPLPVTVGRIRRALEHIAPAPLHIHVEDVQVGDED